MESNNKITSYFSSEKSSPKQKLHLYNSYQSPCSMLGTFFNQQDNRIGTETFITKNQDNQTNKVIIISDTFKDNDKLMKT